MYSDPVLPPSDVVDQRNHTNRLDLITRRPPMTPTVLPFAVIGGTPRANGYQSVDSTTYVEITRTDCYITTRYLLYDLQISDAYRSTAVTSIEWQIIAYWSFNSGIPTTTLASGSGLNDQFSGSVDLFDSIVLGLGQQVLTEYSSIRLQIKRTGGTGEGAAVRMVKPWILRSVSS